MYCTSYCILYMLGIYCTYIRSTMPQVTVYIRDEDHEAWRAIEKKSQWIHERLNNTVFKDQQYEIKAVGPSEPTPTPFEKKATPPNLGRACCLLKTPCVHWKHDAHDNTWTNVLTGEVKEVA